MTVDYTKLLSKFYPDKLQTKCKGLAKYRYKRHQYNSVLGYKVIERSRLEIHDGKAFVYYQAQFRRF